MNRATRTGLGPRPSLRRTPIYDMVYVALAERRRTQLIAADGVLRQLLRGFDWLLAPEEWLA